MKLFLAIFALFIVAALGDINADVAKAKKYAESRQFLAMLARQCSEEIGLDYETSLKLLLGDFTIRSPKAKVSVKVNQRNCEQSQLNVSFSEYFK